MSRIRYLGRKIYLTYIYFSILDVVCGYLYVCVIVTKEIGFPWYYWCVQKWIIQVDARLLLLLLHYEVNFKLIWSAEIVAGLPLKRDVKMCAHSLKKQNLLCYR